MFGYRLASEFNAPAEILGAGYQAIRRTDAGVDRPGCARSAGSASCTAPTGRVVALFENRYRLQRLESDEPELTLEPLAAGAIPTG